MSIYKFVLIGLALVSVVAVLGLGLISFGRDGEEARRRSNRLMRWRIGLQLLAVALIGALFFVD